MTCFRQAPYRRDLRTLSRFCYRRAATRALDCDFAAERRRARFPSLGRNKVASSALLLAYDHERSISRPTQAGKLPAARRGVRADMRGAGCRLRPGAAEGRVGTDDGRVDRL